jgi:periplasmic divalent cation tolerance protein
MTNARIAMTTVGSEEEAARIAEALVKEKLAACVQILPAMQSVYRWQGAICKDREWLLLIKTVVERVSSLEHLVRELHSYEIPEFLVLEVTEGSQPYLEWLATETSLLS